MGLDDIEISFREDMFGKNSGTLSSFGEYWYIKKYIKGFGQCFV